MAIISGKNFISALIVSITALMALLAGEGVLRLKNASMKNYDIEMWKYALKLKIPSENPLLGHEHRPNKEAILQSVSIRTNEYGLRGDKIPPKSNKRRILFLGSSVTLGWGVPEEKTISELIKQRFRQNGQYVEVLNAGIGNYNTARYVERFFNQFQNLAPTDIVVHYVLRDAEILPPPNKNILLKHSQLATTIWIIVSRYFSKFREPSLEEHYQKVYEPGGEGFQEMKRQLQRLADFCKTHKIRLYLAMTPDIHDLTNYQFGAIHHQMKNIATDLGYTYIDLLPSLEGLKPEEIWAMPGDPHPNALGHIKMSDALFPVLAQNKI